jgi:uroporphyrinogen decarboxylase
MRSAEPLTSRQRYLAALECRPVDRPPAWMMRQAGRYLPEYRALRARHPVLDCVHRPELAAEITLQPMRRFPLDAAIVFSDILIVLEAMGLDVQFPAGGPTIAPTLSDGDLSRLQRVDARRDFAWLGDALRLVREGLGGGKTDRALIGFAGAPWTLACYAIEGRGSKDFAAARGLLYSRPDVMGDLLARCADVVADLLVLQLRAGADAVQLFDTWGGMLSSEDYRTHVLPHVAGIVRRVRAEGGRIVVFVKDGEHLTTDLLSSDPTALGFDWRADMTSAASHAAGRCAIQGNLDPAALLGSPAGIRRRVEAIHDAVGGRTGHVFNLGHGILPSTPTSAVDVFLAAVDALGGRA